MDYLWELILPVLLLLHANKLEQDQELVFALPYMFSGSTAPVLLQAAIHVREKKILKAEEVLRQFADKFPGKSKSVLLSHAQITAIAIHSQISAESLSKIPDIQHMPCTVSTIVSLKEHLSDINGAAQVLDSAIQWWRNSMTEDNKLNIIMQEAASFKLNHGHEEEASQLYEELVKGQWSVEALAGLITTTAHTDLEKAELYENKLKALPGLKGINMENLEKTHGSKQDEGACAEKMEVSKEVKKADNIITEEEKKFHEKVELIMVKFLRIVHRLGHSSKDNIVTSVLYHPFLTKDEHQLVLLMRKS